jgi:hypothetical protein
MSVPSSGREFIRAVQLRDPTGWSGVRFRAKRCKILASAEESGRCWMVSVDKVGPDSTCGSAHDFP